MGYVSSGINIIISAVFFSSFYMKAKSPTLLRCEVYSYHVIADKYIKKISSLFLLIELALAIVFALNLFQSFKNITCILLLVFFCLLILKKQKAEGKAVRSCSCFGEMKLLNKYPLIRNCILILILNLQFILPNPNYSLSVHFLLLLAVILSTVYMDLFIQIKNKKELPL